jgi:hypothetical protein
VASEVASTETSVETPAPVEPLKAAPAEPEPRHSRRTRGPHDGRFFVLYVVLGLAVLASVAGVIVAALGSSLTHSASSQPWSSWRPSGGGLGAVEDVATHVAPSYKLPGGSQLVDVLASSPEISPNGKQTLPLSFIAVRRTSGDLDYAISGSDSVFFQLCGLGAACSIATGTPSVARNVLVRREILELALYTFKYVPGMENVVAVMPPPPGKRPGAPSLVFLRRSDLAGLLSKPLTETLSPRTPLPNAIPAREVATVNTLTSPRIFTASVAEAAQGFVLVLKRSTA